MKLSHANEPSEKTSQQSHPVIVRNLKKSYGKFEALKGISLEVKKGECVSILGPNGAGKTTLIKVLSCIYPYNSGEVKVYGLDTKKNPRKIKNLIGVIPQENSLDPDLTVYQNIYLYATYYSIKKKNRKKICSDLLQEFGLSKYANFKISQLSGGLKRRLTIARAFVNNPKILILDEPTTGLDPQARNFIWEKLESFKTHGITMILTTHYIEEASRFSDNVYIMDNGLIVASGSPESLISDLGKTYVVEILKNPSQMDYVSKVKEMLVNLDKQYEETKNKFYVYTNEVEQILDSASRYGLANVTFRRYNLEDVFIKLTGRELRD